MSIIDSQVKTIVNLLWQYCNVDRASLSELQSMVQEMVQRGTYRVRYDTQERLIGYCDYDLTEDGMLHVRKIVGLKPGVLTSLASELKRTLPWKLVLFFRAKLAAWRHHARPWRISHVA